MDVFKGDDVPTDAVHKAFNGIKGDQVADLFCFETLWFPHDLLPIHLPLSAKVRKLFGVHAQSTRVMNDSSDGLWFWTHHAVLLAIPKKQRVNLFTAEIGVDFPETPDFFNDTSIPQTPPLLLRSTVAVVQGFELAASRL